MTMAILGSALFFVAAPSVVAGLIPWWITRWEFLPRLNWFAACFRAPSHCLPLRLTTWHRKGVKLAHLMGPRVSSGTGL
jgi:hypothetical protein